MKTLNIIALTFILLFITVLSTGAGHGTFLIAKIVYPFTMLIAILSKDAIGIVGILLAIVQVPFYAWVFARRPKWKLYLAALHVLAVAVVVSLDGDVFG